MVGRGFAIAGGQPLRVERSAVGPGAPVEAARAGGLLARRLLLRGRPVRAAVLAAAGRRGIARALAAAAAAATWLGLILFRL